jgi:putative phosphoribosyl transferase
LKIDTLATHQNNGWITLLIGPPMNTPRRYTDRAQAAMLLARELAPYRGRKPLILAIPRGAVPMAKIIADQLNGELDVILVHKLGAPFNPEYAIGAIDESGAAYLAAGIETAGIPMNYIEQEKRRQHEMLHARRLQYTPFKQPADPAGRVVIIIDDGLATGATMIAALRATRAKNPAELVCAVPVAAPESLEMIRPLADNVVCLQAPANLLAIGQFYENFEQVTDEQVKRILALQQGQEPA